MNTFLRWLSLHYGASLYCVYFEYGFDGMKYLRWVTEYNHFDLNWKMSVLSQKLQEVPFSLVRHLSFFRVITSRRASKHIRTASIFATKPKKTNPSSSTSSVPKLPSNISSETTIRRWQPSTQFLIKIQCIFYVYSAAAKSTKKYTQFHSEKQTQKGPQRPRINPCILPR